MDFNQQIIAEFRASRGRVSGPFEGARLLLLTTTGARSGARHTTPVGYLPDGDRILVIASGGAAPGLVPQPGRPRWTGTGPAVRARRGVRPWLG